MAFIWWSIVNTPAPFGNPPKRILLVDDHADSRTITALVLTRLGFEVYTAGSVREARQLCEDNSFDLLLGDIGLPDGSGLDLMREMAETRHVRGIAYTACGRETDIAKAKAAGFSAYLLKPVDTPVLLSTITHVLDEI